MADIVVKIQQLQALGEDIHWFCPRIDRDDGSLYFDEDVPGQVKDEDEKAKKKRLEKIEQSNERRVLALDGLQILAFDGPDAAPYKDWLKSRLDAHMTLCDVCIRVYHRSRADLEERLGSQYEEHEVSQFLSIFDDMNNKRIKEGLDSATDDLMDTPPSERGINSLSAVGLYAIFEALSCGPFLRNETLLQNHFDKPFQLIQTNKRLRLNTYSPAMAAFLFCMNEARHAWAFMTWTKFRRPIMEAEFDWCVKTDLENAMTRVHITSPDQGFLPVFWNGVRVILNQMQKEQITNCLRAMDLDVCRFLLDHLQFDSEGFGDMIGSFQMLLEKSPTDFWDAMGTISPAAVAEQVFNSPSLHKILVRADSEELDEVFSWISPFLASIRPSNLTPACRSLANQLMHRLQSDRYSRATRFYCYKIGLGLIVETLRRLNEGRSTSTFVGRATCIDIFEFIGTHTPSFLREIHASLTEPAGSDSHEIARLCLNAIHLAVSLDCLALSVDREAIVQHKNGLGHDIRPQSTAIWEQILKSTKAGDVDIFAKAIGGALGLSGIEKFIVETGRHPSKEVRQFNECFDTLSQFVCDMLEKASEFPKENLSTLFNGKESCNTIVRVLLSSHTGTHQATVELIKTASSTDGRKEALEYLLKEHYANMLDSLAASTRNIARWRIYDPTPRMLKICSEVNQLLGDSQLGILRSKTLTPEEATVTGNFWQRSWEALTMMFHKTEQFSTSGRDKRLMMEYCRDTMEFAGQLFESYSILATALCQANTNGSAGAQSRSEIGRRLLDYPKNAMNAMVKWLRLRDPFLLETSVNLTKNILIRLQEVSIEVDNHTLVFIKDLVTKQIKSKLSQQQCAELERAVEKHTGQSFGPTEDDIKKIKASNKSKQGRIDVSAWQSKAGKTASDEYDEGYKKLIAQNSTAVEQYKQKLATRKRTIPGVAAPKPQPKPSIDVSEFKRQREAEKEAKKKRDALAIAHAKRNLPLNAAAQTAEAVGIEGKVPAEKGSGMMVSSDESDSSCDSSSEDDMDMELFGRSDKPGRGAMGDFDDPHLELFRKVRRAQAGPVKKRRMVRSARDMRARLAPDLSPLHKVLLSWDYFHDGDFPPGSKPNEYSAVPNTFMAARDYQQIFQPLLTLEAWQGFVKAREENTFKPFEVKVVNRSSVDAFMEVSSTMSHQDNKDSGVMEGDIVLLAKTKKPATDREAPHCLSRVGRITRKKTHIEVLYRIVPGNPLIAALVPNGSVFGAKIQSITPLEREYGALQGLLYYDLCDEIIKAKPSPLLNYTDKQLEPFVGNYSVNRAQAKAVKSAIDNDAFTLIQGPPGSGKTKTIVAIAGALLTESLRDKGTLIQQPRLQQAAAGRDLPPPKKMLVCAPSNAAVDELVMRFKQGVKTTTGLLKKVNIVRLGRSDAINTNIRDVTLDELVAAKLNASNKQGTDQREQTQKLMKEHQSVSEKLRESRAMLDEGSAKGDEAVKIKEEFDALRRKKTQLGTQIDNARDNENTINRQAELNRKRAQQEVFDQAHVICATLSGSGHDMFQNLNIEFETVIVDEAAQCVEMSALIPLKYGCAKCILVGDPKQLPPTVFSKEAARFQYEQSLFVRMQSNHPNDVHLLDTQYRMHPEISAFPSATFYDGRLVDGPDMAPLRARPWHSNALLGPYRFFDVKGQHQSAKGHSLINLAEIDAALELYAKLTSEFGKQFDFRSKIGIITPYKSQLRELKERFSRRYGQAVLDAVDFNTTDAFQGRESEIIIFSCVRASPAGGIGFLQDIRRMNVGLTRAKSSLWVLGNSQSLVRGEFWRKLIEDARKRGRYTEGDVKRMVQKAPTVRVAAPMPAVSISAQRRSSVASSSTSAPSSKAPSRNMSPASSPPADAPAGPKALRRDSGSRQPAQKPRTGERKYAPSPTPNAFGKREMEESSGDIVMPDAPGSESERPPSHARIKNESAMPGSAVDGTEPGGVKVERGVDGRGPPNGIAAPPPKPRIVAPRRKKEINPFMPQQRPKKRP